MEDRLENYTPEEIEQFALQHLVMQEEQSKQRSFQIVKIDKEYKKHRKAMAFNTIKRASFIILTAYLMLHSNYDTNLTSASIMEIEKIKGLFPFLPKSELASSIFIMGITGVQQLIQKMGVFGFLLAYKSVGFVLSAIWETKKGKQLKQEIATLQEKLEQDYFEKEDHQKN